MVDHPTVEALAQRVICSASASGLVATGSRGSSTPILAGALAVRTGCPVLLVVAHPDEADEALEDLQWFGRPPWQLVCHRLAALEMLPGESGVSLELLAQRIKAIELLQTAHWQGSDRSRGPCVWVAPIHALMQGVPKPHLLSKLSWTVRVGQRRPMGQLLAWLADAGYERVDGIEQPGQFAVRGGIVDIYLPAGVVEGGDAHDSQDGGGPIRLDYFGDQVESICRIDPDTMGSDRSVTSVQIVGADADQFHHDDDTTQFLSLLPEDTVVVMHEMAELSEQARGYYERLINPRGVYPPRAVFEGLARRKHVQINQYTPSIPSGQEVIPLPVGGLPTFDVRVDAALTCLAQWMTEPPTRTSTSPIEPADGHSEGRVVVLCQKEAERARFLDLIEQHMPQVRQRIVVEVGYLHRGFVWGGEDNAMLLVPHHELFHRYEVRRQGGRWGAGGVRRGGRATAAFLEMATGDYVVHTDHGIAQFEGLCTMRRKHRTEECLKLRFAGSAHLYVPTAQIDLVQKYIGGFRGQPPLSQLGGKRWARQKQQVTQAVQDLAAEMLRVQAARASQPGIRYPPDTPWQIQFEAEFPYEATEDQIAAIAQVKKDMDIGRPMDRLICGDVGFGKTEIAIRAAFKAVQFGKQVAVLVPTTLLAEQHERTFRQRMADYPVRVASISRLKTGTVTAQVLAGLAQGHVDVIIGTHRLLSNDVRFSDLGLVVIDEEQRFGVEHKQKLMQLRLTVDVLTLSATPIPRTLHMSMLGLRDISSLTTPPLDRRAIVTEVIPFDTKRIQQAIVRELNRDGQVYFVHNRVRTIQSMADQIQSLVPEARVVVGHGQMSGRALEQVMLRMVRRQVDVLVCTTIIESGIDIPSANTILIHGAGPFWIGRSTPTAGTCRSVQTSGLLLSVVAHGSSRHRCGGQASPCDRAVHDAGRRFQDRDAGS